MDIWMLAGLICIGLGGINVLFPSLYLSYPGESVADVATTENLSEADLVRIAGGVFVVAGILLLVVSLFV